MTDDGIQSVAVEQLEVLSGITVYGKTVTVPNPGKVLLTYLMMGRETLVLVVICYWYTLHSC